jgi:hypothetical protein
MKKLWLSTAILLGISIGAALSYSLFNRYLKFVEADFHSYQLNSLERLITNNATCTKAVESLLESYRQLANQGPRQIPKDPLSIVFGSFGASSFLDKEDHIERWGFLKKMQEQRGCV